MISLYDILFAPILELIRPMMLEDALNFELNGLNCKEEAIRRINEYYKRTTTPRMTVPILKGIFLLITSGILLLSLQKISKTE